VQRDDVHTDALGFIPGALLPDHNGQYFQTSCVTAISPVSTSNAGSVAISAVVPMLVQLPGTAASRGRKAMDSLLERTEVLYKPRNSLLAALPAADRARLMASLERTDLHRGQKLHEPGESQEHFYFPETCVISLLGLLRNGESAEMSLTGNEGGVGLGLILGGDTTLMRATVQRAGIAFRWKTAALRREVARGGIMTQILLRYVQAVWTQTAQSALCNKHHTLQQQLCRWLLCSLDRGESNTLHMTQQLIADMLGVRRETVAIAASRMQHDGWIWYRQGVIVVVDRHALESHSCECYEVVKAEQRRLLRQIHP
jgi:CRP-like cAMP-binding protein